jgi:anti-repressor protein
MYLNSNTATENCNTSLIPHHHHDDISLTTVEIAQRTNKEHRNVLRDTRTMLVELYGEISLLRFEQSYMASNGQDYQCYLLPKKEILVLVRGIDV